VPTCPPSAWALVTTGVLAAGATEMVSGDGALSPLPLVATNCKLNEPGLVGVPVTNPVALFTVSHAGPPSAWKEVGTLVAVI